MSETLKKQSAENESTPTEYLPDLSEKLKNGIKLAILGPPHSGKTTFIDGLLDALGYDDMSYLSTSNDGEGRSFVKNINNPEVQITRKKGNHSNEYIEHISATLSDWNCPITIMDVGGKINDEKIPILRNATHAIILSSDDSETKKWRDFTKEMNVELLAEIKSYQDQTKDPELFDTKIVDGVGEIFNLERGVSSKDRLIINQVAEMVRYLAEQNTLYRQKERAIGSSVLEILDYFPCESIINKSDQNRNRVDKLFNPNDIPKYYEIIKNDFPRNEFRKVINGKFTAWGTAAISCACKENEINNLYFDGFDGEVAVRELGISKTGSILEWQTNIVGNFRDLDVVKVSNNADKNTRIVKPEELNDITIPRVDDISGRCAVVISDKGPNWLKASTAISYMSASEMIAVYDIRTNSSIIVWVRDVSKNGDALGKSLEIKGDKINLINKY